MNHVLKNATQRKLVKTAKLVELVFVRYSVRSTCIGSTDAALRAGR
jgi:hypothetical protein